MIKRPCLVALLHKAENGRTSPYPGRSHSDGCGAADLREAVEQRHAHMRFHDLALESLLGAYMEMRQ